MFPSSHDYISWQFSMLMLHAKWKYYSDVIQMSWCVKLNCLFKSLLSLTIKKLQSCPLLAFCERNPPVMRKIFPCYDDIMKKATKIGMLRLTHCGLMTPYGDIDQVDTGYGNSLLPDGTKSLPEPMFTCLHKCSVAFTREWFHKSDYELNVTCVQRLYS